MAEVIDSGHITLKISKHEYRLILEALHLQVQTLRWTSHQGKDWRDRQDETTTLIEDIAGA